MSGDVGEISLRDNCLQSRHFGGLNTGGDTGIPAAAYAANSVGKGQMALDTIQYADVTVLTAAVKTMFTTPVVLVAAPGAGLVILVQELWVTYVYGAATYACNAAGASLFYKAAATGQAVGITVTQAFIQLSSWTNFATVKCAATLVTDATANLANQAIAIKASTTDPTTGDGTLKFRTYYRVVPGPLT